MDFDALAKFLKGLDAHNTKEWFDKNRPTYEALRKDWILYVQDLISDIQGFDPLLGPLEASKCIFRINKDIRFSKDKSPYKTNFGAIMNKGGKKEMFSGYYIHFDPKEIFVAGGAYQPSPELLAKLRQEIDYNYEEFHGIATHKEALKKFNHLGGEKLARPPKGYEADNPAIDYLKHKSFIWVQNFTLKEACSPKFKSQAIAAFKSMKPLNDFINRCID